MIDPTAISVTAIKEELLAFINSKPDAEKWKDFYESSTGTMFIELLAAMGGYIAYQSLIARREAYLWDAKIRSSNIALAESKGYPVYRGKNEHFILTMNPTETASFEKYAVIGQCLDKDIVVLENLQIIYNEQISVEVAIGDVKEIVKEITTSDPTNFRFNVSNVSEDFMLLLDGIEVPISKRVLDLLNDYYCVLTNSLESIDVLYLNIQPPSSWLSNSLYSNGQYVTPNFSWRAETNYTEGQRVVPVIANGLFYECIVGGLSSISEPSFPLIQNDTVNDNEITWKCLGGIPDNIYFKSIEVGTAYSGSNEPIWPIEIGATIQDNEIIWQCLRDVTYSKYPYESGSILTLRYIELGELNYTDQDIDLFYGNLISTTLENSYSEKESIEDIKINASLYHETGRVIKGRKDYSKIFRELLPNSVDTNGHDVSPAVVELSYVKDHTTELWSHSKYINVGDNIMPSIPNNYIYQAVNSGYTAVETMGVSGETEPVFPTTIGETVVDNQIVWECSDETTEILTLWTASTEFNISATITPTIPNGYYYSVLELNVEPIWNLELESEVTDNEITWKCIDTIFLKGYNAQTWEVDKTIEENDFIIPIVAQNFFYIAKNAGITGTSEPLWPIIIGDTVDDNGIVWECYDLIDAEKYQKNRALELLASYRPFGIEPPTIVDPKIVYVLLDILVSINSVTTLLSTVKNDIDAILETHERNLYATMEIEDIEYEIEQLSYVKIARVNLIAESKSTEWSSYTAYRLRDIVIPTVPNGFYYESYYNREAAEQGYSQGDQKVYSQAYEPGWPTTLGETITGGNGHIVWECIEFSLTDNWKRNTLYELNTIVNPTISNGFSYKLSLIVNLEPDWPTVEGESVVDNDIYWVCKNISQSIPKCDWKEYYIIGRKVTIT